MLEEKALGHLAEKLFDLSPDGFGQETFRRLFKHPSQKKVQQEATRLWKGLITVADIARNESSASKDAIASLLRDVRFNEGTVAENAVSSLLAEAVRLRQVLPSETPHIDMDPDRDARTTGREYETYVVGFELPSLFKTLYPGVKFGTQKVDEDTYEGAGVDFTLACCKEIRFGKINVQTMRKMIDRARNFGLTRLETH